MCRVFLLSTAVLKCCHQTNSEKNITPIIQSWTQHTHLCVSYFNDCLKSIKSVNPRSSTCSARHPAAKDWVIIPWPPPKFTNTHLRQTQIPAWDQRNPISSFMLRAHKQVLEPNNASHCWWIYLFNDKAPSSITGYQLKAKSAGKSSRYRSAVSPAMKAAVWIPSPANPMRCQP